LVFTLSWDELKKPLPKWAIFYEGRSPARYFLRQTVVRVVTVPRFSTVVMLLPFVVIVAACGPVRGTKGVLGRQAAARTLRTKLMP
jgi:hypothetical protein